MSKITKSLPHEISLASEECLAIRKTDWNRIKRLSSEIEPPSKVLNTIYSVLFGISITSLFSWLTLPSNSPSWMNPTFIIGAISSLLLGGVIFYLEQTFSKKTHGDAINLTKDMNEIDKSFQNNKNK